MKISTGKIATMAFKKRYDIVEQFYLMIGCGLWVGLDWSAGVLFVVTATLVHWAARKLTAKARFKYNLELLESIVRKWDS